MINAFLLNLCDLKEQSMRGFGEAPQLQLRFFSRGSRQIRLRVMCDRIRAMFDYSLSVSFKFLITENRRYFHFSCPITSDERVCEMKRRGSYFSESRSAWGFERDPLIYGHFLVHLLALLQPLKDLVLFSKRI